MTNSENSSYIEKLIEHKFLAELMFVALKKGYLIEISKPEVDNSGYDLVIDCNGISRYVQLKTTKINSITKNYKINQKLFQKNGACIILIINNLPDESDLMYRFCIPSLEEVNSFKTAKHTKANSNGVKSERKNIRLVKLSLFSHSVSVDTLFSEIFSC